MNSTFIGLLPDPLLSFLFGLLGLLIAYAVQPRVKLRWTVSHNYRHFLLGKDLDANRPASEAKKPPAQNMVLNVNSLLVVNNGRGGASSVEVVLNWKPLGLSVAPPRQYFPSNNPEGRYVMMFPNLGPKESFAVHMIDGKELPDVVGVRSESGDAKHVSSQPQITYPRWAIISLLAVTAVGAIFLAWAAGFLVVLAFKIAQILFT